MEIPPQQVNPWETTELLGGIGYHPVVSEIDRVSTYTGLDDYDTLFEATHDRGALDHVPKKSEEIVITITGKVKPTIDIEHPSQRGACFYDNRPFEM